LFSSTATAIHAPSREIPTPSGDFPTAIRSDTSRAARSTTTSAPPGWSLTYSRRPSGVAAIPRGLPPVLMVATTRSLVVSITDTVPDLSLGT